MLDRDGDGVIDREDECPCRAEDVDGFEDADGCPEFDNDGDAIVDDCDACPNNPEVYDRETKMGAPTARPSNATR